MHAGLAPLCLQLGVEPQVQRIGAFKSAGDQLLRRNMSDAQREQLEVG